MLGLWVRRVFSVPAVLVAGPITLLLTPIVAPFAIIADLVTGRFRLPLLRLWLFAVVVLLHEYYGVAMYLSFITARLARRPIDGFEVLGNWLASLVDWSGRLLGVEFQTPDLDTLPDGRMIVLSRHASNIDAVIPATLVTCIMKRPVHYVIKRELRFLPSLDFFVPKLNCYFVARDANETGSETTQISAMAKRALEHSALVIFPEGTFPTKSKRAQIIESLERREHTDALELALELDNLLPPKPGGALAMLNNRPDADVVIMSHLGLDGVTEFRGLRDRLPLRSPITVRWWVIPRSEVPTTEDEQIAWLQNQWRAMDRWISTHRDDLAPGDGHAADTPAA